MKPLCFTRIGRSANLTCIAVFSLVPFANQANAQITPAPPIVLNGNATTDTGEDWMSGLAAGGQGAWVAVWESSEDLSNAGFDRDIFISRSSNDGLSWSLPAILNTNAAVDSGWDRYPRIATDSAGNWVAVWQSTEALSGSGMDQDIFVARSSDDGWTWSPPTPLNANAATDSKHDYLPQITTDGAGNWMTVWQSQEDLSGAGTDHDIFVARSTNNGANWTPPAVLNSNAATDTGGDFSVRVAADKNGVWLAVWQSVENLGGAGMDPDLFMARSLNNGASWSTPSLLNTNGTTDSGWDGSHYLATDGLGVWIVIWESNEDFLGLGPDSDILFARSTDMGETWTAPAALHTNATADSGIDNSPRIASDGSGTWIAVWETDGNFAGVGADGDLLFVHSTNNGVTWSEPSLMNTDAATDSLADRWPEIDTDGASNWAVVWSSYTTGPDADISYSTFTVPVQGPPTCGAGKSGLADSGFIFAAAMGLVAAARRKSRA